VAATTPLVSGFASVEAREVASVAGGVEYDVMPRDELEN